MRVTIKDVARECGVSPATVSLALAGREGRVSEAKRERIREAARRMNYIPNSAASGLARRQSRAIGIVISDLRNSHISELYMGILSALQEKEYSAVCYILEGGYYDDYEKLIGRIVAENLGGLIWAKPYEPDRIRENQFLYETFDHLNIPVMAMDHFAFRCRGINVCFDYEKAGYMAVRYLIEQGHVRIGCISGPPGFQVTRERLAGYRRALQEEGLMPDPRWIYEGDYTMESGSSALPYLLGQRVTAIFAQNDAMAFGVYRSARNYGIRIPDSLSLIGCDNVSFDDVLEVPLSTVGVPAMEMGRYMGEQLCAALERGSADGETGRQTKVYEPNLYLRGSVKKIDG